MEIRNYKILLREEPEGGFTVFVPSLEGCITYGKILTEAKRNAKEAIELYIESLQAAGAVRTGIGKVICIYSLKFLKLQISYQNEKKA
jgi:predicted RNase H-like HicB family nuclease